MISKSMEKAINDQINAELYSSYLYLAMSAYFQGINLEGFANWMRIQYQEETFHALKFYDYLAERSGTIQLLPIEAPPVSWENPVAVFEETLTHERKVTGLIHNLADMALTERDHGTATMLQWFINEQVEEESTAERILVELKRVGDNSSALFILDRELRARVFTPPTAAAT